VAWQFPAARRRAELVPDELVPDEARAVLASLRAQVRLALERADLAAELARRASEDPLTQLANRAGVRVFDTAMHTRAMQRLDFETALRRAVIRQRFTVRYQPVVRLPGGELAGLEALVRWDHPERPPARPPATGSAASRSSPTRSAASTCRFASSSSPTCSRTWPAPSTPPASTRAS
jgi:predicted signal transduction protein with EAL and GGDEF domain